MLERIKRYFQGMTHWQSFFVRDQGKVTSSDKICCIDIFPDFFTIGYGKRDKDKINLIFCETYPYAKPEDFQTSLVTITNYHHLDTADVTWILQPDQYQLLLIDALPVPPNEFQAAVRWKIKDLIRFPLDDIVVDSFDLPIAKPSNGQAVIMVVVAKKSEIKSMSDQLQKNGLNINKITIPEMSLKNIVALFNQDQQSTALIYMQNKNSQLVITDKQLLNFNRRIELGFDSLALDTSTSSEDTSQKMDRLALEIQRSFDYYQSQWRQPLPAKIMFASTKPITINITDLLSQRLSIPVEMLNIAPYFINKKLITQEEKGKYLLILGTLLDKEGGK